MPVVGALLLAGRRRPAGWADAPPESEVKVLLLLGLLRRGAGRYPGLAAWGQWQP